MAVLLVLRRAADPRVAGFLADADPLLVVEAARAIHDVPIHAAYPALAALASLPKDEDSETSFALHRRVIDANLWLGTEAGALALAAHAADADATPTAMRALALEALGEFAKPRPREIVWGRWRPLADARPGASCTPRSTATAARWSRATSASARSRSRSPTTACRSTTTSCSRASRTAASRRRRGRRACARWRGAAPRAARLLESALAAARDSDEPLLRAEARDVLVTVSPARGARGARSGALRRRARRAPARASARSAGSATRGADALLVEAFVRLERASSTPASSSTCSTRRARAARRCCWSASPAYEAQRAGRPVRVAALRARGRRRRARPPRVPGAGRLPALPRQRGARRGRRARARRHRRAPRRRLRAAQRCSSPPPRSPKASRTVSRHEAGRQRRLGHAGVGADGALVLDAGGSELRDARRAR